MHKNNAVIVIGRAVIRLAFTDANETAVDIVVGNIIVLAEITVIQCKLAEANARKLPQALMPVLFRFRMIVDHGAGGNKRSVRTAQLESSAAEDHSWAPFLRCFRRSQPYHIELSGIRSAMSVPMMPASVPVMAPHRTSLG